MAQTAFLDGRWYVGAFPPNRLHFVPPGLPVALCAAETSGFQAAEANPEDYCSECRDARARIEREMEREAAAPRPLNRGGESRDD